MCVSANSKRDKPLVVAAGSVEARTSKNALVPNQPIKSNAITDKSPCLEIILSLRAQVKNFDPIGDSNP